MNMGNIISMVSEVIYVDILYMLIYYVMSHCSLMCVYIYISNLYINGIISWVWLWNNVIQWLQCPSYISTHKSQPNSYDGYQTCISWEFMTHPQSMVNQQACNLSENWEKNTKFHSSMIRFLVKISIEGNSDFKYQTHIPGPRPSHS